MIQRLKVAARGSPLYGPYVRWKYRLSPAARQSYFTGMYRSNVWGDAESRSGSGSSLQNTAHLRAELPGLLDDLDIRSLLDIPCGDWLWMQHVDLAGLDSYVGADIVPELIADLNARHGGSGREFLVLDAVSSELPRADAVMVRDLLGHLDHVQVRKLLRNVKRSGATWLLATHYPELETNTDVRMGGWRPHNLTLPPYNWRAPHRMLLEEAADARADKTLAVWPMSMMLLP